jgi:hypothetical protein
MEPEKILEEEGQPHCARASSTGAGESFGSKRCSGGQAAKGEGRGGWLRQYQNRETVATTKQVVP